MNSFANAKVLIVDDDPRIREHTAAFLADEGFEVRSARDGEGLDQALACGAVELVLLDVMLPGEDGLSICRRLHDAGGPPVIMLSANGDPVDRVVGLELGADDYLGKPYHPRELLARIRSVLRRRGPPSAQGRIARFAGYVLDSDRHELRSPDGEAVHLPAGEYTLLGAFIGRPRRVLSRAELLAHARGAGSLASDRAVDVQLSRLKGKLLSEGGEPLIRCIRGVGYILDEPVEFA